MAEYRWVAWRWTILGSLTLWTVVIGLTWLFQPKMTPAELQACQTQMFGCAPPVLWVLIAAALSIAPGIFWLIVQYVVFLRAEQLPSTAQHWTARSFGLVSSILLTVLSFLTAAVWVTIL